MKPLRIGVIFDQRLQDGGGYHQALNAAILIKAMPPDLAEVQFFTIWFENVKTLESLGISAEYIPFTKFRRGLMELRASISFPKVNRVIKKLFGNNSLENRLILKAVDLVYFLGPTDFAKYLESINYVSTVWDLCHRDEPEFPEVRWFNEFERRERSNFRILPKATAIITDSCVNKKNIISRYRIDEEKIFIIPFEPNLAIKGNVADREEKEFNVKQTYNLDCPYIFYPAQFWAHKNHIYILEGLKELENIYRLRVGAVFVGGDKGNMEYIRGQAVEMNLVDRVRILGFMPTADLLSFYQQAICLVMPTYFGPTNLPPLEAFVLGVPLLYSDLPGMREQVGDAALFINLQSPRSMADNLALIIQDLSVRNRLIQNGRTLIERLNAFPRAETLQIVFKNFQRKRTTWK